MNTYKETDFYIQLRAKIFMQFCHNYLHTPGWYKRLLSFYVNLHDVTSESVIKPCIKNDNPLVD